MKALIFNIERHALHDGPGIRTLIFFSGCTLHCLWCSNPEGQKYQPRLMFRSKDCTGCGKCIPTCPHNAISMTDKGIAATDRTRCDACGRCISVCPVNARQIAGREMTVDEVMEVVLKDEVFYRHSGGGVTASGGEPLANAQFLKELFYSCKTHGVHTAVETCGFVPWNSFELIIPYTDLFLFDVKHVDTEIHKEYTGAGCETILDNLKKLDLAGKNITVRVPVIPGFNSSVEDIRKIVGHVKKYKNVKEVHLLPYHRLGLPKYRGLEMDYPLEHLEPLDMEIAKELIHKVDEKDIKILLDV